MMLFLKIAMGSLIAAVIAANISHYRERARMTAEQRKEEDEAIREDARIW